DGRRVRDAEEHGHFAEDHAWLRGFGDAHFIAQDFNLAFNEHEHFTAAGPLRNDGLPGLEMLDAVIADQFEYPAHAAKISKRRSHPATESHRIKEKTRSVVLRRVCYDAPAEKQ